MEGCWCGGNSLASSYQLWQSNTNAFWTDLCVVALGSRNIAGECTVRCLI